MAKDMTMDANGFPGSDYEQSERLAPDAIADHATDDGTSAALDGDAAARSQQRNGTTSALTRDAARLRSVMVQASGRGADIPHPFDEGTDAAGSPDERTHLHARDEARNRGDLARIAPMPSLPDLTDEQVVPAPEREAPFKPISSEPTIPAGSRRPTSLRVPAPDGGPARSPRADLPFDSTARSATRLKPVQAEASAPAGSTGIAAKKSAPVDAPENRTATNGDASTMIGRDQATPKQHLSPVYTEIEQKDRYAYGIDEQGPAREPEVRAEPESSRPTISISPPEPSYTRARRRSKSGAGRMILTGIMVVVGTGIGIGLYAGGGDFLSRIFSNENEGVSVVSPSTVTERPVTPPPPSAATDAATAGGDLTPQGAPLSDSSNIAALADAPVEVPDAPAHAEAAPKRPTQEPRAAHAPVASSRAPMVVDVDDQKPAAASRPKKRDTVATSRNAVVARTATTPKSATDPAKGKSDPKKLADKPKSATDKGATTAKDGAGKYVVQVRATPDEAEAKLIAKRLRGKGASNVAIVSSKGKNGATLYRVRYNATGASSSDAQSAATRAGYKDSWVLKQK